MADITTLIGNRFEEILKKDFPELKKNTGDLEPDFDVETFGLEAKVGYETYSIAPKEYQIAGFKDYPKPVIYCAGFHDFSSAEKRLRNKSVKAMRNLLRSQMNAVEAYFISQEVIEKMFEKESRWNAKHTRFYCGLKRITFKQIIDNTLFERKGKIVKPQDYYDLDKDKFVFSEPKILVSNFPYGYILNNEDCKIVLPFLKKNQKFKVK